MKRTFLLAVAGLALSLPVATAQAQMPFDFGIMAGATLPTGDLGDAFDTGFNVGATLGFAPALMPVGMRIDGVYHSMGAVATGADDLSLISATLNAVLRIPTGAMVGVGPYAIGGLGLYSADAGGDRENEFGWNIGAGLRFDLAGFSTFGEVRYNSFSMGDETFSFVPITFGIMF
jgi:hypothetical protein